MTAEQWHDVARWAGTGGMVLLLLSAVATVAALFRGDPAAKPERDRIAMWTVVLIGTGSAVLLNAARLEPADPALAALLAIAVAAAAVAYVATQLWLARRGLRLRRRGGGQ